MLWAPHRYRRWSCGFWRREDIRDKVEGSDGEKKVVLGGKGREMIL